jgi:hypothetical protein
MRRFLPAVLLALALLSGLVVMWSQRRPVAPLPDATRSTPAQNADAPARLPESAPAEAVRARDSLASVDGPELDDSPPRFAAKRESAVFVAVVVDSARAPVAGAAVQLDSWIGGHLQELAIADDRDVHRVLVADEAGRVAMSDLPEGAYRITARAPDGRAARKAFDFSKARAALPLQIVLSKKPQRAPAVEITVVGADGAVVAEADVELSGATIDRGLVGVRSRPPLRARSDEHGVARFETVRWLHGMAFARAPDGRLGAMRVRDDDGSDDGESSDPTPADLADLFSHGIEAASDPDGAEEDSSPESIVESIAESEGDFEHSTAQDFVTAKVTVAPPGRIAGSIDFAPGAAAPEPALAGATIEAWIATSQVTWMNSYGRATTVPVDGRSFALDGLAPGTWSLVLHAPGGARLVLDLADENGAKKENSVAPPLAEVKSGATTEVTLRATSGATIHGRVHRPDGTPIAGARVVATFSPWRFEPGDAFVRRQMHVWSFELDSGLESLHPLTHVVARTDAHGDYRLSGLQPGFQRILVTAHGLSFDRRDWIKVADGGDVGLDHALEAAGALQGIALHGGLLGIAREGEERPLAIAMMAGTQSFLFGGLRPGVYVLSDVPDERDKALVECGRATVEAGRTTFIDLTSAYGPVEVSGQVLDARGAVTSAVVEFLSMQQPVDGSGGFVFHCGRQPGGGQHLLTVDAGQVSKGFVCRADASLGGGWHGVLNLGSEILRVEARGSDGAPLAGTIEMTGHVVAPQADGRASLRTKRLPLDASGTTTIEHLDAGRYDLHVVAADGARFDTQLDLPRADTLRIDLRECGSLVVHVSDADGKPLPLCSVEARTWLGEGEIPDDVSGHEAQFCTTSAFAAGDGTARLARVRSGKVIIEAQSGSFFVSISQLDDESPLAQPRASIRLDLAAGEQREVELRVPRPDQGGH